MTEIGRLKNVDPRHPWPHESSDFTPWLADNLDQLGEAIGIVLELEDSEVSVDTFYADILARDPSDGSLVLIENQLESTDHKHLGQLLTYMAGLDARVVVWIAREFREAHLSAIKWLNENTVEPFAFFAVRLRVVQIGNSPVAPIFEILSRPNDWERRLQASHGAASLSDLGQFRKDFWDAYLHRYPDDAKLGVGPSGASSIWLEIVPPSVVNVALWVGRTKVGLFVRGPRNSDGSEVAERLEPNVDALERNLGARYGRVTGGHFFSQEFRIDMNDQANWPEAIDWLHERARSYFSALKAALTDQSQP